MAQVKSLVVAWGWGWWAAAWWGGGAWGFLYNSALLVTPQAYTITVGTGWVWSTSETVQGSDGWNSVFSSLTAIWGGWGGSNTNTNWRNWGSWWWNSGTGWSSYVFGTWTSGQWNNGGIHILAWPAYGSGGWGGASAVGTNGTNIAGGNGWAGIANSISWSSVTYAGGGGASTYNGQGTAGTGGAGGGGNASVSGSGSNGTANTGWGGWWWASNAGWAAVWVWWNGWSGIVIISYATDGSDGVSPSSAGGTKTTSGGQTIHTFTSSGTFTMVASVTANPAFLLNFL